MEQNTSCHYKLCMYAADSILLRDWVLTAQNNHIKKSDIVLYFLINYQHKKRTCTHSKKKITKYIKK